MTLIGLDIGGTKCAAIRAGADGRPVAERRFATTTCRETLARLMDTVAALDPGRDPVIGISCGGPLDAARGLVQAPPNLPDWDNIDIVRLVEERFGGRAYLMNDANAGALAEWHFGAARGCRNVIFLTHGTGMGAGLILDGRLYEGTTGDAGEVGHMRLAADGPVGYGKAGSFEGLCSGGGIGRMAEALSTRGGSRFGAAASEAITARYVVLAAEQGDAEAVAILAESGRYLGLALSMLVDVLNPEVIVLGSLYRRAGKFLEPAMTEALRREALGRPLAACRIVAAGLGEEIGDYAALAVALYRSGRLTAKGTSSP